MKRYTVRPPHGITTLGSKYGVIQDVMNKSNELFKLFDKLGAYEDTGLEPGEIMEMEDRNKVQKMYRPNPNIYCCPACGENIEPMWGYCPWCGQHVTDD